MAQTGNRVRNRLSANATRMEAQLKPKEDVAPGRFVSWPSGRSPAQCLIEPEPQVTAFIPPPIVQVPFLYGNPTCAQWLATQGLSGQVPHRRTSRCSREKLCFLHSGAQPR